ncbi:MAG: alkaline phosphatase family protein [Anaerolineales bacterium]|nr:alkaline phosphatase family protein [Anaerolineales bacterium]
MTSAPLIILGLDAGDPRLLETWSADGRLPTLAALRRRGAWGRTGGPELVTEHGVWLSLVTGVSRSRHGLYYLRQPPPGFYHPRPVSGRDFDTPPFWAALRGTGRRVAAIDVPDMPLVPGLPGLQLADWAVHYTEEAPAALPAGALTEAARVFGPREIVAEDHTEDEAKDRAIFERLKARVRRKGALLRHLLAGGEFDLIVAALSEAHTGGHQLWRHTPEVSPPASAELAGALCQLYQAIDAELGRLLAALPGEANVLVVASVGLKDQYPTGGLGAALLRERGYQPAPSGGRPVRGSLDVARRLLPEALRARLSRGLPRARREALLAQQYLAGTDWGRATAFALPTTYTSMVRVNLRGREPQGVVQAGAEYEQILAQLEADFAALVDPLTGGPAVLRLDRATALFGPEPPAQLPDLFVEWQPARHFVARVAHPRGDLRQARPEFFRGTDHSRAGFIVAAGPDIAAHGQLSAPFDALDLAPTALALLGQPAPPALTGRVAGFVQARSGPGAQAPAGRSSGVSEYR